MMVISQIEPFRAIGISRMAHALQAQGRDVIHMEFGQPSTGAPREAIARAHDILDTDGMGYWESDELKARLARHYRDAYSVDVDPERFILTCGASPALVLALVSNFSPGDTVAFARPGYVAYRNTLRALHLTPIEIACGPSERFQLTAETLARIDPAPAGMIIASPANPTGTIISPRELAAIADICDKRGIKIVSDEIYHGLSYAEPARSLLEFAPDATIVGSFSKYFSMVGWRLGWLLVPSGQLDRARAFMGNLFLTPPSLSQHAGLVALDCRDELNGHLLIYARNRDLLLAALPAMGLGSLAPPDGAFYLYVDVGHFASDSLQLCKSLLQDTGVALAPGIDFDPIDGHRFIRICFAIATGQVEAAIQRMSSWFGKRMPALLGALPPTAE